MTTKVLHVFGRMNRGGAEMRTLELLRHVDRSRYSHHFCVLSGLPGELDEEIVSLGGMVHLCRLDFRFPWRFRQLLRQERFDTVHANVHYSSGLILRLAAAEGVRTRVAHFRSTQDGKVRTARRRLQEWVMRGWIERHATHILAVSEAAMVSSWRHDWRSDPRCRVVYSAVDVSRFAGEPDPDGVRREFSIPEQARLVIHIGRMDPAKNHLRLVEIFRAIAQRDPMTYLLLVGRGEPATCQRIESWAASEGLANRIVRAGVRGDVPRLLQAADLMLFPSLWEGLPGAVIEACAAGTPVLASDLPEINEIAFHLPLVHLLPLSADDETWAHKAICLFTDPALKSWRAHAAQAVKNSPFDVSQAIVSYCQVWDGR